jgi:nucleotide-binding universal stress UspA family protein
MTTRKKIGIRIRKIIVPTDFTVFSDHALDYAVVVAKRFHANILIMHVIEPFTYSVTDMMQVVDHYVPLKTIAQPMLEILQNRISKGGVKSSTVVTKGTPYLEIIKKARKEGTDLIVMGTHGRTGAKHVLMGSVAERVVRMAPCPVLTVK